MHWFFAVGIFFSLMVVSAIFFLNKPPEGQNRFGVKAPSVNFVNAVQRSFSNYLNFRGRARRSEFWYAMLFYVVVCFLLGLLNVPDILVSIFLLGTLIPFFPSPPAACTTQTEAVGFSSSRGLHLLARSLPCCGLANPRAINQSRD